MSLIIFTIQDNNLILKVINGGIETQFIIYNITKYPKEYWNILCDYIKNWSIKDTHYELYYDNLSIIHNHKHLIIKSNNTMTTISLIKHNNAVINAFYSISDNPIWKLNDIDMIIDF